MAVIDVIEDEDAELLAHEQEILDKHDDKVASLAYRLKQLSKIREPDADKGGRTAPRRRLSQLDKKLSTLNAAINSPAIPVNSTYSISMKSRFATVKLS